ncbi:MAG: AAA family ATPase [Holophagales bacterium]|nr:AAA family ATPase [Holophagales bacterium]
MSSGSTDDTRDLLSGMIREMQRGILGQDGLVRGLLLGVLADGHLLIEGVPGLGKTRAVMLLARICQLDSKRLQFTPDLLPADILGTRIYNQHSATFETVRGPVFTHFVLADEINRAPAKVQSALLETMQERQVTIGQESLALPRPFLVFATQNPIEQEGTYPLPEAQLDRFLLKLRVGYPEPEQEQEIVRLVLGERELPEPELEIPREAILALQKATRQVFVEDRLVRYATELVLATRQPREADLELARFVELGASPRGSIALAQAARAHALLDGRSAVIPDDIKAVAPMALRHRVLTTYFADAEGVDSEQIVDELLRRVNVP